MRRLLKIARGIANTYVVVTGVIFGLMAPMLGIAQNCGILPEQFQVFVLSLPLAQLITGTELTPVVVGTGPGATAKAATTAQIAQLGGGGGGGPPGPGGCTSIPCPVSQGGTGDTSLTLHGVLVGEGQSPVNVAAPGNAGSVLISQGTGLDPLMQAVVGDCTMAANGTITCTKINGSTVGSAAFLSSGTSGSVLCLLSANCNFSGTPILSSNTYPLHGLLLTEGGSPLNAVAPGAAGTALLGQGVGLDPLMQPISGDCTIASSGAILCTRTNGAAFGTAAVRNVATSGANVPLLNTYNQWSAGQFVTPTALTDGATITPDFSTSNIFTVTLGGNRTLANPTNLNPGQCGEVFVTQDGTGSRTLTFGSAWKFTGGTAPALTTNANATDVLSFCTASIASTTIIAAQLLANVR